MKNSKIAILFGLIVITLTTNSTFAAYTPISRNTCALSIHPYNPTAVGADIIGPTDSQWFNIFSQGTSECNDHVKYPNSYTPQPPNKIDLPLKSIPGINEKSSPETIHNHKYFNDSVQDNYYYKSFTDSFQIILESDTLNNTDLSKLVCYSPGEGGTIRTTNGCSGTLADWGGTEITFDQSTGVINWKFATSGAGRPRLYGINPGLHGKTGVLDTNNEQNRKLEFGVKLTSKNVNSDVWTATTTSRTLVRDQAILTTIANLFPNPDDIPACTNDGTSTSNNDYSKWCTLPDSRIGASSQIEEKNVQSYSVNGKSYSTGGKSYYWKQVGVATTAWNKFTPALPPLACADLTWSESPFQLKTALGPYVEKSTLPYGLLPREDVLMKFNTIYETDSKNPGRPIRPVKYHWVAFNGQFTRPNWFINDDTISLFQEFTNKGTGIFFPFLTSSLPGKILTIAHAAPNGMSTGALPTGITTNTQTIINSNSSNSSSSSIIEKNQFVTPALPLIELGKFSDEASDPNLSNPLFDDDGRVHYTGGSAGVILGVQAFYADNLNIPGQGKMVDIGGGVMKQKAERCHLELTIQDRPDVPSTCQQLVVKFFQNGTEVSKDKLVAGQTYNVQIDRANSRRSDGSNISKYTWGLRNLDSDIIGEFVLDPSSSGDCGKGKPNDLTCKYNYTPRANDVLTFLADPHDNVAACRVEVKVTDTPVVPVCRALNLTTSPLLPSGEITVGQTITLSTDPRDTLGNPRSPVVYEKIGEGSFTPVSGNPLNCPPRSSRDSFEAPAQCRYTYTPSTANSGDQLTVRVKDHNNVPECSTTLPIVKITKPPICQALNLTTSPLLPGGEIKVGQTITLSVDPRDTLGNPRSPVIYEKTGTGNFTPVAGNPLSCPPRTSRDSFEAPAECRYTYTPSSAEAGDQLTVRVKENDDVPACSMTLPITKEEIPQEKCLSLNLQVNGQYTLNPLLNPGQSYALQAAPITTLGNRVAMLEWTENGSGQLVGTPGNPAICPAAIDNGAVTTPSFCRYIYAAPSGADQNYGFSVRAVPDDGVAACQARAQNYNPPVVKNPYCLYLDLDTSGTFNPLNSNMNATVVMSDGSKYIDRVRFTSTDGQGAFSGGFQSTGGSTSDLRSLTDGTNNTQTVNFSGGRPDTGINVLLSDTNVTQTAACQRQLRPRPIDTPPPTPPVCRKAPRIEPSGGNRFTAIGGDSLEFCWSIRGVDNPLFNNGGYTATGRTVTLNGPYTNFDLRVEDCNPRFRDICSATYHSEVGQPRLEKRISKNSTPLRYGTKISYSTTGSANTPQTVAYKIDFTPGVTQSGSYLRAQIYDPAFKGTIQGYKTSGDGQTKTAGNGNVDFSNIANTIRVSGFNKCQSNFTPTDKCYQLNEGYLLLNGITSPEKITIEYTGLLTSGITIDDCRQGRYCNEQFINQSLVTKMQLCVASRGPTGTINYNCTDISRPSTPNPRCEYFYNDKGERVTVNGNDQDCKMPTYTIASNTTIAELVCQYFLTRASGDIFLEDELKYGIDVSKCYPFKNISSTVAKPVNPIDKKLIKTGTPEIVNISHEICSAGQSDFSNLKATPEQIKALTDLFGSKISTLSSQICEVGLVPGENWDKTSIDAAIAKNIGKLTRWKSPINPNNNIDNINQIKQSGGVYYYKGTTPGTTVTINGLNIPENSGALTIIVENADLQINGDIQYTSNGTQPSTTKEIASLGVIVINGNMYVDKDVTNLAGAYFIQRTVANNYTVGNILSGSKSAPKTDSNNQLTINGSVYGNIGPLFEHRTAAGDIENDEGAITIRYDQRIIQNPPAGLRELLGTFSQSQIAR